MADRRYSTSTLTKLGLGALAFNSALAIYNSWGDAGSVAFVLAADAALVLLFLCLRALELEQAQGAGRGRDTKIKAAAWALTTLLTAMFASGVAPIVPLAVGVLVFLCLREFDRAQIGLGGQYAELLKMGFAVVASNSALAHHHARGDAGSLALVFFAYVAFVTLTRHFLRRFSTAARARGRAVTRPKQRPRPES